MSYEETLAYIHSVKWQGSKPGLSRTRALLSALGNPERQLRFVHIAGTNGKGSTAACIASCLQAAGWRVGLYTSPYINRFNERMQVNGVPISDEDLETLVDRIRPIANALTDSPTEFELITALGFLYFLQTHCDIVVLEVGLGGALDSTNVIPAPEAAVITALGRSAGGHHPGRSPCQSWYHQSRRPRHHLRRRAGSRCGHRRRLQRTGLFPLSGGFQSADLAAQ